MANTSRRWLVGLASVILITAFLLAIRQTRELPRSSAQSGPDDIAQVAPRIFVEDTIPCDIEDPACNWRGGGDSLPPVEISVVFVIDSSQTMYPRLGPNYFDLAKNAIVELLEMPGLPINGTVEVSVIQFTERGARGYRQAVHWLRPVRLVPSTLPTFRYKLTNLERSQHSTATLMEMGIREATEFFLEPQGPGCIYWSDSNSSTAKHIVLLTTGEYRVPAVDTVPEISPNPPRAETCPPTDLSYCKTADTSCTAGGRECRLGDPSDRWIHMFGICKNAFNESLPTSCNRACAIRYHVARAREQGITVSAVQLGNDWRDVSVADVFEEGIEPCDAYSGGICVSASGPVCQSLDPDTDCRVPSGFQINYDRTAHAEHCFPVVPDRSGFLTELTYSEPCPIGQTCPTATLSICSPSDLAQGNFERLQPIICPNCASNHEPAGSPEVLAKTLAAWLCEWLPPGSSNTDGDSKPDLCDNCPATPNSDQQDCNRDGIGDKCQLECPDPVSPSDDDDGDGLCDALDDCNDLGVVNGGDDCLIADWKEQLGCEYEDLLPMTAGRCDCDCDNNGEPDLCEAAKEAKAANPPCNDSSCSSIPKICDAEYQNNTLGGTTIRDEVFASWSEYPFNAQSGPWWMCTNLPPEPDNEGSCHLPASTKASARIIDDPTVLSNPPKVLELSLDTAAGVDTNGDYSWFIEGPGMIMPPYVLPLASCSGTDCADAGPFGVIAVEMDLWVDNGCGGSEFDIYILDPCVEDFEFAKRVHVKLRHEPKDSSTKGRFFVEQYAYSGWSIPEAGLVKVTDEWYPLNQWFTFKIMINVAAHFRDYSPFAWNGNGDSVRLFTTGNGTGFAALELKATDGYIHVPDDPGVTEYIRELGPHFKNQTRGVQVRIETNNRDGVPNPIGIDANPTDAWSHERFYLENCAPPGTTPPPATTGTNCELPTCKPGDGLPEPAFLKPWLASHCGHTLGNSPNWHVCGGQCLVADARDTCPNRDDPWQFDSDGDGWGDACDAQNTNEGNHPDPDDDGVYGEFDNCPTCYNPRVPFDRNATNPPPCALNDWNLPDGFLWQPDQDCDGIGDPCDKLYTSCGNGCNVCTGVGCTGCQNHEDTPDVISATNDYDHDSVPDDEDKCPFVYNPKSGSPSVQPDNDCDGVGNACDNCFLVWNPDQANSDRDEWGDACDSDADTDSDNFYNGNGNDSCPYSPGTTRDTTPPTLNCQFPFPQSNNCFFNGQPYTFNNTTNIDGDLFNDALDKCFSIPSQSNANTDGDNLGDICDPNTHITDCDNNGQIDQLQWGDWYTNYASGANGSRNPCINQNRVQAKNDGHCMCLAPGHAFMHTPNQTVIDHLYEYRGGPDGGVCPNGPCGPGISCDDVLRVKKITIRRSTYGEWLDPNP